MRKSRLAVPLSSTKRALLSLAALIAIAAAGAAALYIRSLNRPFPAKGAGPAQSILSQQPQAAPQPPGILDELPPDAPAVAYIDVAELRKLRGTPLAAILGLTGSGPQSDSDYREFVRNTGFDYARDLDRLAVAIWPASLERTAPGEILGDNKVLAIADGRFDERRIKAYALKSRGIVKKRGTEEVYEVPGKPPVSFEFLSPSRIAIASGKDLKYMATPHLAGRDPVVQAGIGRIASAPLFAVARTDRLPSAFYANFKNSPQLERLARSVQFVTLAVQPQSDALAMKVDGETSSMKDALEIAALLEISRVGASMALADPRTTRQLTPEQAAFVGSLVKQVKIAHREQWVGLSLDVTPAMLAAIPKSSAPSSRATR